MPINSRNKGANGEREVARILRDELGLDVHRNWQEQAAHGGSDLIGVPGWCIEVKRAKKYSNKWWEQTQEQADQAVLQRPVLIYKLDYQSWKVEVLAEDLVDDFEGKSEYRFTMPLEAWLFYVRENL